MFQSFPFNAPLIQFGFDTIKQLGPEVEKLGSKRALVITGPTIAKSDILEKATCRKTPTRDRCYRTGGDSHHYPLAGTRLC